MSENSITDILSKSQQKLLNLVKRTGPLSVAGAVDRTELAETTIRQHFDNLESHGLVTTKKRIQGRGRPTLDYVLTDKGHSLFPSQNDQMLYRLLEFLIREGYHAEIDRFLREYWETRRQKLQSRLEGVPDKLEPRMEVVEQFLEDEGFMPQIEIDDDGSVEIRECNCPLSQIVESTRLPCRLEAQFLEQVVDQALERVEYIPEGSPACVYQFRDSSEPAEQ